MPASRGKGVSTDRSPNRTRDRKVSPSWKAGAATKRRASPASTKPRSKPARATEWTQEVRPGSVERHSATCHYSRCACSRLPTRTHPRRR